MSRQLGAGGTVPEQGRAPLDPTPVLDRRGVERFVSVYSAIVLRVLTDAQFAARLERDPRPVLAGYGLDVSRHAELTVTRTPTLDLGAQVGAWQQGLAVGRLVLRIPDQQIQDLSEEALQGIVGGMQVDWLRYLSSRQASAAGRAFEI